MLMWVLALLVAAAPAILDGPYQESSLLQMFAQFGLDTRDAEFALNASGEPFLYTEQDGEPVLWVRWTTPSKGEAPGVMWVEDVPLRFTPTGCQDTLTIRDQRFELYAQPTFNVPTAWIDPPLMLRISARDSLFTSSNDVRLYFDDCAPETLAEFVTCC